MSENHIPQHPHPLHLKKSIGLIALTVYGIGNMLGAGIYGTVGKATTIMGNAVWACFALSLVAAALTGLCYASLGSRYPKAAGAAFIAKRAFGFPMLAYVIGLAVVASGLTSMAGASRAFARFTIEFLHNFLNITPSPAWTVAAILSLILGLAWINLRGLRESAWLNALCTAIETSGLLFIIFIGVKYWGSVNYLDATTPANPTGSLSITLMLSGAVLTFYSFVGFEDLLNISEEVKNPRRTFPIALLTALAITTLIYAGVSITAVSVIPVAQWAGPASPTLRAVVEKAAPWFNSNIFSFIMLTSVVNTALLNFIMGSRLLYGMSKQGLIPTFLGKLHPTRRTPHVAIYFLVVIVLLLTCLGDIDVLGKATALLLLTAFTVVNISLLILQSRPGEPKGGFEIPRFIPVLGSLACLTLMTGEFLNAMRSSQPRPFLPLAIAGLIVIAIAIMYLILRPKALPDEPLEID
jgi:basic amino acid/polyamine antiporter, APA family